MNGAIILCSGGIDSVTTSYYVKKVLKYNKIKTIFFNYGQKSLFSERKFSKECSKNIGSEFIEINLNWLAKISNSLINKNGEYKKLNLSDLKNTKKESEKFYVPCRNIIFLVHAMALAESLSIKNEIDYNIFIGFKNDGKESYPDTTSEFVKEMNKLSKISCSTKINIFAPLIKKDKEDIILLGKNLGVDFRKTFTCYIEKKEHCGTCLACRLRQEGFYWSNLKDPTKYQEKTKDYRSAR
ncbi:MAG: 7-cyano-7-deazaguanine synthase [Nanoarchaeota archaeon]